MRRLFVVLLLTGAAGLTGPAAAAAGAATDWLAVLASRANGETREAHFTIDGDHVRHVSVGGRDVHDELTLRTSVRLPATTIAHGRFHTEAHTTVGTYELTGVHEGDTWRVRFHQPVGAPAETTVTAHPYALAPGRYALTLHHVTYAFTVTSHHRAVHVALSSPHAEPQAFHDAPLEHGRRFATLAVDPFPTMRFTVEARTTTSAVVSVTQDEYPETNLFGLVLRHG